MVDLLHTDAIQQLEETLVGSRAVQVVDLLAEGLTQTQASTCTLLAQPQCQFSTTTSPVPPPS